MEAWIIYYKDAAEYNRQYIQYHMDEGAKLGIRFRLILVEDLEFGVFHNKWYLKYQNLSLVKPDFVICRAIYPLLSKQLELMGIRVFNNSFVSEICNDKARTYQYLAKTGIKMVDTAFVSNLLINEKLKNTKAPAVIKAVDGHGGSQVFLINSSKQDQIEKGLGSCDAVIQPLIGSRHQDLRVYVIGKKIVASVLRTAREGFRSNYSLGGDVSLYHLSKEEKEIVQTIISQFDFGFVGIDFMIGDEGELIFNEIEDVVGARMLYQCSQINIVEMYLNYIVKCIGANNEVTL